MKTAEILHRGLEPVEEMEEIAVPSPEKVRKGTINYYKFKMEKQAEVIINLQKQLQQPVDPNLIPQLATVKKITEKTKKPRRVTQAFGSMKGLDIIKAKEKLEKEENRKTEKKEKKKQEGIDRMVIFEQWEKGCRCASPKCRAAGLKRCLHCEDILRSKCSKRLVERLHLTPQNQPSK